MKKGETTGARRPPSCQAGRAEPGGVGGALPVRPRARGGPGARRPRPLEKFPGGKMAAAPPPAPQPPVAPR